MDHFDGKKKGGEKKPAEGKGRDDRETQWDARMVILREERDD